MHFIIVGTELQFPISNNILFSRGPMRGFGSNEIFLHDMLSKLDMFTEMLSTLCSLGEESLQEFLVSIILNCANLI